MVCLSLRLDRAWLAGLGLLTACAPLPHSASDTAGETAQDDTTAPTSTVPTTTITTDPPGCEPGSECGFCSYCDGDGQCVPEVSCCARHGLDAARCQPPSECYGDDDCWGGDQLCDDEYCVSAAKLPACGPGAAVVQWDMSQAPGSFDLADLDGDGSLDLYATIPTLGALELAYNDGAGNFATGTMVELGEPQTHLAAAAGDLDGDGDLDLAVARYDAGDLVIVFGEHGKFLAGPSLPSSAPPLSVTAADVDLDGAIDLVAIGGDLGSVSLWHGDGLGGFSAEKFTPDHVKTTNVNVVDLDVDGVPDILSIADETLQLQQGEPASPWSGYRVIGLGRDGWSRPLAADLGGDPSPELVVLRGEADRGLARVWPGSRPGAWGAPGPILGTFSPLYGGRLADVTHDGTADLVSATGLAAIAVLVGDGAGGFACEQTHPLTVSTTPALLATGDLDGDGRTEIVAGTAGAPTISVLAVQ